MWSYNLADDFTFTINYKGCPAMILYPKPDVSIWVQTQYILTTMYRVVSDSMRDVKDPEEMMSLQAMVQEASSKLIANYKAKIERK